MKAISILLLLTALIAVRGQWTWETNNGTITITKYAGSGGVVVVPAEITGLRVTSIGDLAFQECTSLTSITIPDSVTSIGLWAFQYCTSLTAVYFFGNAPNSAGDTLAGTPATVYYLPGTLGWGQTFDTRPTALWTLPYPVILATPPHFGIHTNQFSFVISWATNASVAVEVCTNLTSPVWTAVSTNALSMGVDISTDGWSYFRDPNWSNYPSRFYRVRSP